MTGRTNPNSQFQKANIKYNRNCLGSGESSRQRDHCIGPSCDDKRSVALQRSFKGNFASLNPKCLQQTPI